MYQGAIWIHRKIRDHWLWKDKPFSKAQAWIDMLMLANYTDVKIPFKGKTTQIKRGEFIRSRRDLANRWGWSDSAVQRFIVLLENDSMIERKSDQKANHITILNYDDYQILRTNNEPVVNQQRTSSEPVVNIENKDNKDNKEKNNTFFDLFWLNYPKKVGKGAAKRAWSKIKKPAEVLEKIKIKLPQQIDSQQWKKDNGQYIPNPSTYLNQERWEDEVNE